MNLVLNELRKRNVQKSVNRKTKERVRRRMSSLKFNRWLEQDRGELDYEAMRQNPLFAACIPIYKKKPADVVSESALFTIPTEPLDALELMATESIQWSTVGNRRYKRRLRLQRLPLKLKVARFLRWFQ